MSIQSGLKIILITVIIIVAGEGVFLAFYSKKKIQSPQVYQISPTVIITPILSSYKQYITYPPNPDPSGRNVYYNVDGKPYSGAGVITNNGVVEYVVGSYNGLQVSSKTQKTYMKLLDKTKPTPTPLQNIQLDMSKTVLAVEDISSMISPTTPSVQLKTYTISIVGQSRFKKGRLFDEDTTVVVVPEKDKDGKNIVDGEGALVAKQLVVRRFNPIKSFLEELDYRIE